ncbi:nucleotidyltransferase family protein [Neobacillus niacini]|uniref:nucleotidyltransferase family protein n=1 Tax=Neobacillus niacini TaxID=86668 RepID=UPI001C8DAE81|nr:nucleotidyltransferase family protein [Neobacillus niacini]MBY0145923.1 nucleotidyltransferase family protein [Neobacillus niacini]
MSFDFISALNGCKAPMQIDDYDYHKVLRDIEHDGIQSQVYFLLKQNGMLTQTPTFFQAYLKENYDKGLFQNLFIKNQTDVLLKRFEEQGIDVITLKGVYFAEKYFGHIGARATSDIDLLVRLQDLNLAIESVKALGFSVEEEPIPGHFHCSFSKRLPHSPVPLVVELHWGLVKEETSNFDMNDIWNESKAIGQYSHVRELANMHCFYMICLHGWRHNLDSLKYFIDIIQVIHQYRDELDYEELFKMAANHQTLKRLTRTLSIVYEQFPYLNDVIKLPFKRKTLWRHNKVKGLKQYLDFFDYQFFSYDTVKHRLIEIRHWIWPSKFELSCELGENQQDGAAIIMYLSLYRKRISRLLKVIF